MSSPVAYSYHVESNRAVERRAREKARQRVQELEARLYGIAAKVEEASRHYADEHFSVRVERHIKVSVNASLTELENHTSRLLKSCHELETKLHTELSRTGRARAELRQRLTAIAEEQRRKMAEEMKHLQSKKGEIGQSALDRYVEQQAKEAKETKAEQERLNREKTVMRVLSRLPEESPAELREELESLGSQVLNEASRQRADLLEDELRVRVQKAGDEARQKARDAHEAEMLLARFDGLDSPDLGPVSKKLTRVANGEIRLTEELQQQAENAYQQAKLQADQAYATEAVTKTLASFGYEVQEGFSTLTIDGGVAYFQKPNWGDFHVRLLINSERHGMNFNVVRFGNSEAQLTREQELRDKSMEEKWCNNLDAIIEALKEQGVATDTLERTSPGELPVQIVDKKTPDKRQGKGKKAKGERMKRRNE